ncbi:MAG TPA: hypothetical protein VLR88_08150 [Propionibacteriaceae bacterium]|nr:hypothetical protein [Propionibacteriaceae bacterium]
MKVAVRGTRGVPVRDGGCETALAEAACRPVACQVHEAEKSQARSVRRVLHAACLLTDWSVVTSRLSGDVSAGAWLQSRARSTVMNDGVPGPTWPVDPPRDVVAEGHLLFPDRLSPRQGPHVANAPLALLRDAGLPATLSLLSAGFFGDESYEGHLSSAIHELGLAGQVTAAGLDPAPPGPRGPTPASIDSHVLRGVPGRWAS